MTNPYYYANNNSYGIRVDGAEVMRVPRQTESFTVTVAVSLSCFLASDKPNQGWWYVP